MTAKTKEVTLALAALAGIPCLLMIQQALLPEGKPEIPRDERKIAPPDMALVLAADRALSARQPKAVSFVALRWLQHGDAVAAERWMRYGAAECQFPSLMLLYGDFCKREHRFREAGRWFRLADSFGKKAGAIPFCRIAQARLKELERKEGRK